MMKTAWAKVNGDQGAATRNYERKRTDPAISTRSFGQRLMVGRIYLRGPLA